MGIYSVICLPKTGQTISFATGDDGDLEMGVAWPDTRFTDNLDNTVKDNLTGLVWTKNANLPGYLAWQQALDYVAGMNAGTHPNFGYTDWRLPNFNELKSLTDYSKYGPALPQSHPFTNVQSNYWSSTTIADFTGSAWVVSMYYGGVDDGYKPFHGFNNAWPVRSGQGGSTTTTTVQPTTTSVIPPITTTSLAPTTTTTAPPTVVTLTDFKAVPDNRVSAP